LFEWFREAVSVEFKSEEFESKEESNPSDPSRIQRQYKVTAAIGGFTAQAIDKIKKLAKQRTAQQLLKQLHPEIKTYGELLDYYEIQKVESNRTIDIHSRLLIKLFVLFVKWKIIFLLKELHKGKGSNLLLLNQLKEKMRRLYCEPQYLFQPERERERE
jgi:hypothetical protein